MGAYNRCLTSLLLYTQYYLSRESLCVVSTYDMANEYSSSLQKIARATLTVERHHGVSVELFRISRSPGVADNAVQNLGVIGY